MTELGLGEEQAETLVRSDWHDGLKGLMAAGPVDEGRGRRGPPDPGPEREQPWDGRAVCRVCGKRGERGDVLGCRRWEDELSVGTHWVEGLQAPRGESRRCWACGVRPELKEMQVHSFPSC